MANSSGNFDMKAPNYFVHQRSVAKNKLNIKKKWKNCEKKHAGSMHDIIKKTVGWIDVLLNTQKNSLLKFYMKYAQNRTTYPNCPILSLFHIELNKRQLDGANFLTVGLIILKIQKT